MYFSQNWLHCRRVTLLSQMANATVLRVHGLRVVVANSEMKICDVSELLSDLSNFFGVNDQTPTIYDLRSLDFAKVSTATIKQWVSLSVKHTDLQRTPGAFLVHDTLGFGMMRMFQVLNDLNGGAPENRTCVSQSVVDVIKWARTYRELGERHRLA